MIRRPPRSTQSRSSAASDVYKRQINWRKPATERPQQADLGALLERAEPGCPPPDDLHHEPDPRRALRRDHRPVDTERPSEQVFPAPAAVDVIELARTRYFCRPINLEIQDMRAAGCLLPADELSLAQRPRAATLLIYHPGPPWRRSDESPGGTPGCSLQ